MEIQTLGEVGKLNFSSLKGVEKSSGEISKLSVSNFEKALSEIIQNKDLSGIESSNQTTFLDSLPSKIDQFSREWSNLYSESQLKIKRLSVENRELLDLQIKANQLNLAANVATKAAETVSSTFKKLNQLGFS